MNLASGVAYVGGRTGEDWAQTCMDDGRRPAAGEGRGRGRRRRASYNCDVMPWAWLTGTDGRAGGYKSSCRRAA